ncbi:MAG TPA: bifunctional phosphoribosylaminoimidazolecarboxamide formyltransferase/IMP cyclohydrolase, partial [Phycisphaerales bacterium]|nr:bifunctional phosphoribosylaminoimidazolecarboxamide formyltransferase/IMP cyclohydrolase [Phycisphaerales bacterium]
MTYDAPLQRALISVSNKVGIVDFARALSNLEIEIISTGGTAKVISEAGIPVTSVDSLTGFPEMLDGRVKTLHPIIHGGLLGVRDNPSHVASMEEFKIKPIDLICIDLYPFEETIAKDGVTREEVIEQIDIGGPAMIRSAAKNYQFVTVVTNPRQYPNVLADLEANNGTTTLELREDLASAAFTRTADYDTTISQWMVKAEGEFPNILNSKSILSQTLRYGENPDQAAAVYRDPIHTGPSVVSADI